MSQQPLECPECGHRILISYPGGNLTPTVWCSCDDDAPKMKSV